jgi:hypothetical protein
LPFLALLSAAFAVARAAVLERARQAYVEPDMCVDMF